MAVWTAEAGNRRIDLDQLKSVWQALDNRRRVVVLVATVAMFAAVLVLSRMAASPSMSLLYAGLESGAAGEVITALDQRGVAYEVRGDSIWVDGSQRDALRMSLASDGLPANGNAGYELLDGLSGFGTTSQMFDAAYWRAKEGELARTIVASPNIRAARVHISSAQPQQPFTPDAKPTASVTVTMARGDLAPAQVKALKYLIASAVEGMKPEEVAVIDSSGGLIEGGDPASGTAPADDDRAAALRHNVERLLEARVGPGKAVVEVSVDTETQRESIVEKSFDPQGRVAISSDTNEHTTSSTNQGGDAVTVASNLPTGDAGATGQSAKSASSDTRERVNYEVSQTRREILRTPGAVRRLTVAVLVDGVHKLSATGVETVTPRPAEEIAALHDLVASAVGYDEKRGDVITIKSMAFEPVQPLGTAAAASVLDRLNLDPMTVIQLVVLAVVALALGLFVLRPILTSSRAARLPDYGPRPAGALAAPDGFGGAGEDGVLTGEIDDGDFLPGMLSVVSPEDMASAADSAFEDDPANPVARLRRLIEERQDETVEILRSWMEDPEETA